MPLLNYTTKVSVTQTIPRIHKLLVGAGAHQISTVYADGKPTGLHFEIITSFGPRYYVLPVDASRVQKVLEAEGVERKYRTIEHAESVAWRITEDWLKAQLAIIATEMVTLDRVMLPYMRVDTEGRTVYDLYLGQQLSLERGGSR